MSDLISRSELIKHFETIQSQEDAIGLDFVAIIDEIKEQPTAYSVDKVVEELEKIQDKAVSVKNEDISIYATGMIGKAIEIVKRGGVCGRCTEVGGCPVREDCPNEENVCKWKIFDNSLTDEPHWVYETTCGKYVGEEHTSKAFVYCPYCGEKIKIVGD